MTRIKSITLAHIRDFCTRFNEGCILHRTTFALAFIGRWTSSGCWQSSGAATEETLGKKEFAGRSKLTDAIRTARFGTICESMVVIRVAKMKCDFGFEFAAFLERERMGPVLATLAPLAELVLIVLFLQTGGLFAAGHSPTQSLDFEYYRTRVEPIFLKKRPGHARCVVCHAGSNNAFRLQPLPDGSPSWTEEQSRLNFEIVSRLVTPGDPTSSRLLLHPLSPKAGGDAFHSGGRQFASQNDPDWRVLADWVRNAKINPSTTP